MGIRWLVGWVVVLGLVAVPAAGADGGPVPPQQGGRGASAPGGDVAYVALPAGKGRTTLERIRRDGGAVDGWRTLRGRWGVGAIAFDGSTTGLSADGRTLVLAQTVMIYPPRTTPLAIVDPRHLRIERRITLPGWYTL